MAEVMAQVGAIHWESWIEFSLLISVQPRSGRYRHPGNESTGRNSLCMSASASLNGKEQPMGGQYCEAADHTCSLQCQPPTAEHQS